MRGVRGRAEPQGCMTQVIVDIQESSIICSYTSSIVNDWLVGASTRFVEVDSSLSCYICRASPVHMCLYFMEIFWMGTMHKRKVSWFDVWKSRWRQKRKPMEA